jgi:hypothetical protein
MKNISAERFAAWAEIDVQYPDQPGPMHVVRLDRLGLTVVADGDTTLPPIGLPRRALIVSRSNVLREARLILRATARTESGAMELVMQPSRADDHASLWEVLRARQMQDTAAPTQRDMHSAARLRGARALRAEIDELRQRSWCDASFTMASRDDAQFFASWLDYHFAEVSVYARLALPAAHLKEIYPRVVDDEVEARFVFAAADESLVRTWTQTLCRWIEAEHLADFEGESRPPMHMAMPGETNANRRA